MYGQGCREGADVGEGCMHGGADGGRSSWRREAVLAAGGDLGGGRRASLRREGGVPHSRGALPEAFGFGAGAGIGEEVEVGAQSNLREGKGGGGVRTMAHRWSLRSLRFRMRWGMRTIARARVAAAAAVRRL